jgi:PIN domain-containing protein
VDWSDAAIQDWIALTRVSERDGAVWALPAMLALAQETIPGRSLLGRVLRDPKIWPSFQGILQQAADPKNPIHDTKYGFTLGGLEIEAEDAARGEGARRVTERHLASALEKRGPTTYSNMGLQIDRVATAVRDLELGPAFQAAEIGGRWHGLIDTSIVVEYKDLWSLDWLRHTDSRKVTIWISAVLLAELDQQKYFHRNPRVMSRARTFSRWLQDKLEPAAKPGGIEIRGGVVIRVWDPNVPLITPDSAHLEVAFALIDRSVPIHLVTGDLEQRLRAISNGIPVFSLPESCLIDP